MKITWDVDAFEDIRRLPETEAALQAEVDRVLRGVDEVWGNYDGGVEPGKGRSRGYVVTTDFAAIYHEATEHTLLKALGSGSAE